MLNYALPQQNYTLSNALFLGNCQQHFYQIFNSSLSNKHKVVHLLIALIEFIPIIGQIISIFEKIVVDYYRNHFIHPEDRFIHPDMQSLFFLNNNEGRVLVNRRISILFDFPLNFSNESFPLKKLNKDIFIYIATFLNDPDKIALSETSKISLKCIDTPILWNTHLEKRRIWGATNVKFNYDPVKGWVSNLTDLEHNRPLTQLQTYFRLSKKNNAMDYIARLMPGGPVAFSKIPYLTNIFDASLLSVEDVNSPISIGTDRLGYDFLAFRIHDKASSIETMLVFVYMKEAWEWKQIENELWQAEKLKLKDHNALNYILALIRKEDLSQREEFQVAPYQPTIELW